MGTVSGTHPHHISRSQYRCYWPPSTGGGRWVRSPGRLFRQPAGAPDGVSGDATLDLIARGSKQDRARSWIDSNFAAYRNFDNNGAIIALDVNLNNHQESSKSQEPSKSQKKRRTPPETKSAPRFSWGRAIPPRFVQADQSRCLKRPRCRGGLQVASARPIRGLKRWSILEIAKSCNFNGDGRPTRAA